MIYLPRGKASVLMDGGFGSTGKGLLAAYIESNKENQRMVSVSTSSPNSGHTLIKEDGTKVVTHHLPMFGTVRPQTPIVLCAGSIIDPELLKKEIEENGVDPETIAIHRHAAIVTPEAKKREQEDDSPQAKIASTQKGVSEAITNKIRREGPVAENDPWIAKMGFCDNYIDLHDLLNGGYRALIEVPQGLNLGVNSGFWPYVTSREVSVSQALSDAGLHPSWLGEVITTMRTFPIRVGHILDDDGEIIGESGPFWFDSSEIEWGDIGVPEERTTVTNRVRRVATFSFAQYRCMFNRCQPDYVFLNFVNYLDTVRPDVHLSNGEEIKRDTFLEMVRDLHRVYRPTATLILGFGPRVSDIYWDSEL